MNLQAHCAAAPKQPMPVSDSIWERLVTLSCSLYLSEDAQQRVIGAVRTGPAHR